MISIRYNLVRGMSIIFHKQDSSFKQRGGIDYGKKKNPHRNGSCSGNAI